MNESSPIKEVKTQIQCQQTSEELALLREINNKVDSLKEDINDVKKQAIIAGGVSGAVTSGIVAVSISLIKAKFGIGQ